MGDSASSFTMQQASMSGRDADSPCTNCNGVSRALLKAYSWSLTDPIKLLSTNGGGGGISDKFKVQDVSLELRVNLVRISRWDGSRVYLLVQLKWLPVENRNVEFSVESLNSRFSFFLHNSENEDLLYKEEDCNHRFVSNSSDLGFTIFVPLEFENTYKKSDSQNFNFLSYEIRLCFISFGLECVNLASPNLRKMPISLRSCGFRMLTIISSSLVYLYHFQTIRSLLQQLPTSSLIVEDSLIAAVQKIFVDMDLMESQGARSGPRFESIDILNVFEAYGLALTDLEQVEHCAGFLREFLARLGRYCENDGDLNPLDGVFFGSYRYFTLGIYTRMRKFDCLYLDIVTTDDIYQALNNACMNSEEPPIQSSSNLGSTARMTEFHSFPSVLHLVLKRFKFDAMQGKEIKLMTYFDVPTELEIDHTTFHALLPMESENSSGSSLYKLFSVVAHEGTSGKNGHYMTYVKSADGQNWKRIASQLNTVPDDHLKETASRSACFLTYIRQSEWNQLIV